MRLRARVALLTPLLVILWFAITKRPTIPGILQPTGSLIPERTESA